MAFSTWSAWQGHEKPPPRRIDYVLMRGGRARTAQIIESPASDHAALAAEVALPA